MADPNGESSMDLKAFRKLRQSVPGLVAIGIVGAIVGGVALALAVAAASSEIRRANSGLYMAVGLLLCLSFTSYLALSRLCGVLAEIGERLSSPNLLRRTGDMPKS